MYFNEPIVEFVAIDPKSAFVTDDSCTDSKACEQYGVETCLGESPMNNCSSDADWV